MERDSVGRKPPFNTTPHASGGSSTDMKEYPPLDPGPGFWAALPSVVWFALGRGWVATRRPPRLHGGGHPGHRAQPPRLVAHVRLVERRRMRQRKTAEGVDVTRRRRGRTVWCVEREIEEEPIVLSTQREPIASEPRIEPSLLVFLDVILDEAAPLCGFQSVGTYAACIAQVFYPFALHWTRQR